ncbi:MAG: hypothetical protein AAF098_14150 [Pseudomonadota bacterium]
MPEFEFEGAFRISRAKAGVSSVTSTKGAFAVHNDLIYVANARNERKSIGIFRKPALQKTALVADMPIAPNIKPFFDVQPERVNESQFHITGVFYDSEVNRLYVSLTEWYDADKSNRSFLSVVNLTTGEKLGWYDVTNRQMAAGQILKTPTHLQDRIGRLYMHPEHWISIISRKSAGPGLHGWDGNFPKKGKIELAPFMYYPHTKTLGQHGAGDCRKPASPIFNRLARYEVSFFWKGSYISVGKTGGLKGGTSYGRPPYGGPKGTFPCIKNDYDNYYWIWDVNEIFSAARPWSSKPVEYGRLNTHIPEPGWITGAYFDTDRSKLYLMTAQDRIQSEYEWNPVIFQYQVR